VARPAEAAVAREVGRAEFGVERSGRYGELGVEAESTIEVECVAVTDVLEGLPRLRASSTFSRSIRP
jgi:hypothetical protein